jgi:hypothetical protein
MARHLTPELEAAVDVLGGAPVPDPPAEDGLSLEVLGRQIAALEHQLGAAALEAPELKAAGWAIATAEGRARAFEKAGELLAGGKA